MLQSYVRARYRGPPEPRRTPHWLQHRFRRHPGATQAGLELFSCASWPLDPPRYAGRMPKVRKKANSQSRSSLVANVITKLYATSDPRFSTGFKMSTNVGAGCGCHPTSEQSSLFSSSLSTCLARPVGGFSGLSRVHYVWEERNGGTEANADLFLRCRTLLNA